MKLSKINLKHAHAHLSSDPAMELLIKKHSPPTWPESINDLFIDLVESIIGQQLSGKAANTIVGRFNSLFENKPNPEDILSLSDDVIRSQGLSYSKIAYIKGLSQAVLFKELVLDDLIHLSDEDVIEELVKLKGIGRWTAEMILMFSLARPDVFSVGDLGLRTAVGKLYNVSREDKKAIEEISLKWKPWRSVASRYLWKSLDEKV